MWTEEQARDSIINYFYEEATSAQEVLIKIAIRMSSIGSLKPLQILDATSVAYNFMMDNVQS